MSRRLVPLSLVAAIAAAAFALPAAAAGATTAGKSSDYKPAGAGTGHRIR